MTSAIIDRSKDVSIIVPTLNEEALIEKVLVHARQTAPKSELIVVDGGSEDKTVRIARKYAKVLSSKGRVGRARNAGAKAAAGKYLLFLDADTYLNAHFFNAALSEFSDPKVVGVGGKIMPEHLNPAERVMFEAFNAMIAASFAAGKPVLAGTCVMYRKNAFRKSGGFDEGRAASEDFDLCERMAKIGKVVFLGNVITRTSKRRLSQMGILGLVNDWGRTTWKYYSGVKEQEYAAVRKKTGKK